MKGYSLDKNWKENQNISVAAADLYPDSHLHLIKIISYKSKTKK